MELIMKGKKVKSIDSICSQLGKALEMLIPCNSIDEVEFYNDKELNDRYIWSMELPFGKYIELHYIKENGYIYCKK